MLVRVHGGFGVMNRSICRGYIPGIDTGFFAGGGGGGGEHIYRMCRS